MNDYKHLVRHQPKRPIFYYPSRLAAAADAIGIALLMLCLYLLLILVAA